MADLSRLSGVPYDSVNKYMRGDIDKPRGNTLERLAVALDTTRLFLQEGLTDPKALPTKPIPIRGEVAAGIWLEAGDLNLEPESFLPFNPAPRFPDGSVYCLTVRGDSMDKTAPEGATLVCVDIYAAGIEIRDRDMVIVERQREQGGLIEVTAKRVRQVPGGYELMPESTNPRWQPYFLASASKTADEVVRVIARVEYVLLKP
jgi:SOS-response transcriptional repressor LexA